VFVKTEEKNDNSNILGELGTVWGIVSVVWEVSDLFG
jgi:hypothetical protein